MQLQIAPVSPDRWKDLERLFGKRGACGGCWCMYFRKTRREFEAGKGEGNRADLRALVDSENAPGLMAYDKDRPVGWCAVGPRAEYSALSRSRILKPVDETPVWSVVCFFVEKSSRRKGISTALLRAAAEYAKGRGALVLEGYPVDPVKPHVPDVFAYTGLVDSFRSAGFQEVARRSETRPIMRLNLGL